MLHVSGAEAAGGIFGMLPPPCQSSPRSRPFALLMLLTVTEVIINRFAHSAGPYCRTVVG
eukprot:9169358-Pyramimonas_sp.AAC.1